MLIPPAAVHFLPACAQEVQECNAREKVLWEERARRAAVLEAELRSTRGAMDDTAARYDDALGALNARRLQVRMCTYSTDSSGLMNFAGAG